MTKPNPPPGYAADGAKAGSSVSDKPVGLELRGLWKRYGKVEAVRGIDLSVSDGEFLTLLGPSGSGKTTVLRLIAGFTLPTEGQVLIGDRDVSRMTPAQRGIGMVPQGYALFPHLTVADNVEYGLKMRGWRKGDRHARAEEMLELVGLADLGRRLPRALSGGQQQRVALARALAFGPSLLLMDEPLGALDRELRVRMAAELHRIHSELGTTVLYVTHDREEALALSDRIAVMHAGELNDVNTPRLLYERPSSSFVAGFFGAHNLLKVKVLTIDQLRSSEDEPATVSVDYLGNVLRVKAWCQLSQHDEAQLAVPATAISFHEIPDALTIKLHVVDILYFGEVLQASCQVADGTPIRAEMPAWADTVPARGADVDAWLDLRRVTAVT